MSPVMETYETRYVEVGDADVAYKVVGEGPIDLLYFYGLGSHIELLWDTPMQAEALRRLASFSRLILFDRRGAGASDRTPVSDMQMWEALVEDVEAVLDAVGSKQAAIMAGADGGPMAMLFAALHPERVRGLVLFNTSARTLAAEDYPIGLSSESVDALVETIRTLWGTPDYIRLVEPSIADDFRSVHGLAKQFRASATPRAAAAQFGYRMRSLDVRQALPLIQAPTLVLQVQDSPTSPIERGRFLAEHIHGATLVEIPGGDVGISTPQNHVVIDKVAEFLTGERLPVEVDRVLTTVLFTDIVGSTERAASLGDQRWRSLLDAHDTAVREQLRLFRGNEINTTGDGFVASFDGPARAIRCATAIVQATDQLGVGLRAGLHTGECEVRGDNLGGLAVHIAARVGASADQGEVLVSSTVKDLVAGSGIQFSDRGEHDLKGVPGTWRLFSAVG